MKWRFLNLNWVSIIPVVLTLVRSTSCNISSFRDKYSSRQTKYRFGTRIIKHLKIIHKFLKNYEKGNLQIFSPLVFLMASFILSMVLVLSGNSEYVANRWRITGNYLKKKFVTVIDLNKCLKIFKLPILLCTFSSVNIFLG